MFPKILLIFFLQFIYVLYKPHQLLALILFSANIRDGSMKDAILSYTRREEVEIFDKNEVGDYL